MLSIEDRRRRQEFFAFVSVESIDATIERILRLVNTGRRMTVISQYLPSRRDLENFRPGNLGIPEVKTGLVVDTSALKSGLDTWEQSYTSPAVPGVMDAEENPHLTGKGLRVLLTPGINGFGVGAYKADGTEQEVADRFHSARPIDATHVRIYGFGDGFEDRIEITSFNENGVGRQTIIAFDLVPRRDLAETDARVLDALASTGQTYTPETLTKTAERMRFCERTIEQQVDPEKRSEFDRRYSDGED